MRPAACLVLLVVLLSGGANATRSVLQANITSNASAPSPEVVVASPSPAVVLSPSPAVVLSPSPAPVVAVPVPAPVVASPSPAPVVPAPAPVVPAPAPAPVLPPPLPLCGVVPQCKVFVEDMLCCQSEGALTDKTTSFVHVLCSHAVQMPTSCLNVTGPVNVTTTDVFNEYLYSKNHRFIVNWTETLGFGGPIGLDLEKARLDVNLAATCSLDVTPCRIDNGITNTTYTTSAKVAPLNFTAVNALDFTEGFVGCPALNLAQLDSWVWMNSTAPKQCLSSPIGDLPAAFFTSGWINYAKGTQNVCNTTATLETLPLPLLQNFTAPLKIATATGKPVLSPTATQG